VEERVARVSYIILASSLKGKKYADVIARIVESVQTGLDEVNSGEETSSESVSQLRKVFQVLTIIFFEGRG
jgi:hypothetical protein